MKNLKIVYMLAALLLAQSAYIMPAGLDDLNDQQREEVVAAVQNGWYVLTPDSRYVIIKMNDESRIILDLRDAQQILAAQAAQQQEDEKEGAEETDTDHPTQR